jgi:hypothetical protein
LPIKVAFVITSGLKREEESLVQILVFFIFVVLVVIFTLALGYGLSLVEDQIVSRRCRMPHEMHRRRKGRRQRVRYRFEG